MACFVDGVVPQHGVSGLERAGTAAHHTRRCHGTALDVSDSVRSEILRGGGGGLSGRQGERNASE